MSPVPGPHSPIWAGVVTAYIEFPTTAHEGAMWSAPRVSGFNFPDHSELVASHSWVEWEDGTPHDDAGSYSRHQPWTVGLGSESFNHFTAMLIACTGS